MRILLPSRSISSSATPLELNRSSSSLISSMVITGSLQVNKLLGRGCQNFAAVGGDQHSIFNTNTSQAVDIRAWFDGNHHPGLQFGLVFFPDAGIFMDLKTEAMTGGMDELAVQPMPF